MCNLPAILRTCSYFTRKRREIDSVLKWTAKVDIFKTSYIVVPINESWVLVRIYSNRASETNFIPDRTGIWLLSATSATSNEK